MATKRRKRRTRRRSCKNGKLKRPVRTKKGGKRRCKKSKKKSKKKSYKMWYTEAYEPKTSTKLEDMPDDILLYIFENSSLDELENLSKTNLQLRGIAYDRIRTIIRDLRTVMTDEEIELIRNNPDIIIDFTRLGETEKVRKTLKYFPEYINARDKYGNGNALIYAIMDGNAEIVKLLIDAGADITEQDIPLGFVRIYGNGNAEIVDLLRQARAT